MTLPNDIIGPAALSRATQSVEIRYRGKANLPSGDNSDSTMQLLNSAPRSRVRRVDYAVREPVPIMYFLYENSDSVGRSTNHRTHYGLRIDLSGSTKAFGQNG
jgi:hypothetical protein